MSTTEAIKARCTTCDWTLDESELTPECIEHAGPGANGVWQFGEWHEYQHCEWIDGEPPELHSVIMEPSGMTVEAFRNMLTGEWQWDGRLTIPPRPSA